MPVDVNGDPVTIASVTDQTGATRTWSVNALGQLVANGDPLADDTKEITVLTTGGDTVVGTVAVNATAYFVAGQTDQTALSADMEAIRAIGAGISGKTIYCRPSAQVARLRLFTIAVTSEITITNEVAGKPATASQLYFSGLGASGSVRVEGITVDGSLYPANTFSIVHLLSTGANFTMDGCTIKGTFDPIGNGYTDNDYRYHVTFTGKTGTFAIGEQLTGGTSTGDAEILDVLDNGDGTGTLWLNDQPANVAETFQSGEIITSSGGATATTTSASTVVRETGLDGLVCGTGCSWDNVTFINGEVYNVALPFKTILSGNGQTTITDNVIRLFYGDGFKPVAVDDFASPSPFDFSRNTVYDCMTDPRDADNPHTDVIQPSGASNTAIWSITADDNQMYIGENGRALEWQQFFLGDTNNQGYTGTINNNFGVTGSVHAISCAQATNLAANNNTFVTPNLTDTFTTPRINIGSTLDGGGNSARNNVAEAFLLGGSVLTDNNVTLGLGGATIPYATAFAPSDFSATPTTLAASLTRFTPAASGPLLDGASYVVGDTGCINSVSAHVPYAVASVPPLLVSSTPVDDSTGIAIDTNPTLTFTDNMAFGTGNITIYDVTNAVNKEVFDVVTDAGTGPGTVSVSGKTVTIEPTADLDNLVEYAIHIDATALDNTSGVSFAGIADNTTVSFTTVAAVASGINFVGYAVDDDLSGGAAVLNTTSLTSLTGGIGTAPAEGDIVIVATCAASNTTRTSAADVTGYTRLYPSTDIFRNVPIDANLTLWYKIMGPTPDTSVDIKSSSNSGDGFTSHAMVFRGVDTTTPFDVSSTQATGSGDDPDPAAITPITTGALILVVGHATGTVADASGVELSESYLSNVVSTTASSAANTAMLRSGTVAWTGGAYDPAVMTSTANSSGAGWCAATMALRPAP